MMYNFFYGTGILVWGAIAATLTLGFLVFLRDLYRAVHWARLVRKAQHEIGINPAGSFWRLVIFCTSGTSVGVQNGDIYREVPNPYSRQWNEEV